MSSSVSVQPAGFVFSVQTDETLLDAAQRQGVQWPTVCLGSGICLTCYFVVLTGIEQLSPQTEIEKHPLDFVRRRHRDTLPDHVRLACQTRIGGDIDVYCKAARAPLDANI
jgi:ferredoxin, 2Fe-2S